MSYKRQWLLEDRVYYIKFLEQVTLDDITEISQRHQEWLATTQSLMPLHYLVDASQTKTYPRNVFAINNSLVGRTALTGWMVLLTQDYFVTYVTDILAKKVGFRVKSVNTIFEGYQFLQQMDGLPAPQSWVDNDSTMPIHQVF